MAEQTITFPEPPEDKANSVQLVIEPEVPPPAFIEIEDAGGTHRYVPVSELEAERALNAELVEALKSVLEDGIETYSPAIGDEGIVIDGPVIAVVRAALAKAEAREKGDG